MSGTSLPSSGLLLPVDVDFKVILFLVPELEADQSVVGGALFLGHFLEVVNDVFFKADRDFPAIHPLVVIAAISEALGRGMEIRLAA